MRKILFLTTIFLAAISCQEEDFNLQEEITKPLSKHLQVVQITEQGEISPFNGTTRSAANGELALQFATESDYQSAIKEISHLSDKEKLAFAENFTSLQKLSQLADKELDKIGETATNESDFKRKYEQYVKKYDGKLIANKYDREDLTLYVPNGDNPSTYLINENSKVVIGNEIKKVSLNGDMSTSEKTLFATVSGPNKVSGKTVLGKQKTTYAVTLQQNIMLNVHIGFQKKMWYGWKRDNNRDAYYYLETTSPFQYSYWARPTWKNAPLYLYDTLRPDMYFFGHTGTVDYETGYIISGSKVLTGRLYVWTDYTVGPGTKLYKLVIKQEKRFVNEEMPVCNTGKAYKLDFTVNYLW